MAGAAQNDPDDIITGINVTPLVDIILVLLIIFMLTANLIARPSIQVKLPEASTGEATEPTTLGLTIKANGELFLNGVPTDEPALKAYIPTVLAADKNAQAIIAADTDVPHGKVVHIIDLVRRLGIFKFALNIDPNPEAVDLKP